VQKSVTIWNVTFFKLKKVLKITQPDEPVHKSLASFKKQRGRTNARVLIGD